MSELHVIADERTIWRVYETGTAVALTEHTSATDAELAARALADDHGAQRVIVHDRYHRTHDAAASPRELWARAARARDRQLAAVRARAGQLARARTR